MSRILQLCLHKTDNLGDTISHEVLLAALSRLGIDADVEPVDMLELRRHSRTLDDRIDEINRDFDCVVLGSGGLLHPGLLDPVFRDSRSWRRLNIPLILLGVGIIKNEGTAGSYALLSAENEASPTVAVLKAASVVAVRDLRTMLLAQRIRGGAKRVFLTGCPSMQFVRTSDSDSRYFLINMPLNHGPTTGRANLLAALGRGLTVRMPEPLWFCHSASEEQQARRICNGLENPVRIVRPRRLDEIGPIIASCTRGMVIKAHPAIFMLANLKPFISIAYDMKSSALLEMIWDDAAVFSVPLWRLQEKTADAEVSRIVRNLNRNAEALVHSMANLRSHFDSEYAAFESAFRQALGFD